MKKRTLQKFSESLCDRSTKQKNSQKTETSRQHFPQIMPADIHAMFINEKIAQINPIEAAETAGVRLEYLPLEPTQKIPLRKKTPQNRARHLVEQKKQKKSSL